MGNAFITRRSGGGFAISNLATLKKNHYEKSRYNSFVIPKSISRASIKYYIFGGGDDARGTWGIYDSTGHSIVVHSGSVISMVSDLTFGTDSSGNTTIKSPCDGFGTGLTIFY